MGGLFFFVKSPDCGFKLHFFLNRKDAEVAEKMP